MTRLVGTMSMGVRCPIIREGDDLSKIVPEACLEALDSIGVDERLSIMEAAVNRQPAVEEQYVFQ